MTEGQELFVELLLRKLQEKPVRAVHDRLEELLEGARRGIALRERYSPKIGRRFLLHPNGTR